MLVLTASAQSDYSDYANFASATQTANSAIRIGTLATDAEAASPANSTATGDDLVGDDEDLTMPAFTVGSATTLAVPMTITAASLSGSTARVNVFVDWNGDNDVLDANETLIAQTVSASGTFNFSLTPPAGTTAGTKYLRIRAVEGATHPGFSGTSTLKGEVEDYAIAVSCQAITVNPTSLSNGNVGLAYSQTLTAAGGSTPYTFALTTGTLPAGLSLNASTGVISGTPTAGNGAGTSLTFTATDALSCTGTRTLTLKVCPVISIATPTATGTVGTAYSSSATASGGASPYVYAVASGSLPAGLTLNTSTGAISGTPTTAATSTFTISATDANACQKTFGSLTITTAAAAKDFGDWNGAGAATTTTSSTINSNLTLGATVDSETSVAANSTATTDDVTGTDDEDAISSMPVMTVGQSTTLNVPVINNTGSAAYLNAWIDFDNDGTFDNALISAGGERLAAERVVNASGTQAIVFTVPGARTDVALGMRLRLTSTSGTLPTGAAGSGEVEDYTVTIQPGPYSPIIEWRFEDVQAAKNSGFPYLYRDAYHNTCVSDTGG